MGYIFYASIKTVTIENIENVHIQMLGESHHKIICPIAIKYVNTYLHLGKNSKTVRKQLM